MPKHKGKASQSQPPAISDDEDYAGTQPTGTAVNKAMAAMAPEEQERLLNDLVKYLLISDQKKTTIKRVDINKCVLKEYSRSFPAMMGRARDRLLDVFGINLVEVEGKKAFILVNTMDTGVDDPHLQWPAEDNAKMGLLMVVLATIFMSGNTVTDTNLWHTLKKIGVDVDANHHEVFGDAKKLITKEFVSAGYLECVRQPNSDPPAFEFRWGYRAKLETDKKKVLKFVCDIYGHGTEGGMEAERWVSQYRDVENSQMPEED